MISVQKTAHGLKMLLGKWKGVEQTITVLVTGDSASLSWGLGSQSRLCHVHQKPSLGQKHPVRELFLRVHPSLNALLFDLL